MEHVLELGRVLPAGDPLTIPARNAALAATIRAVAAGDQEAFARLYADYVRMVHAILLGRVPRRDVDDLVQDVFLTAYTRIRELREPAAFGAWIATIARNRATDYLADRTSRSSCRRNCRAAIRSTPKPSPCSNRPEAAGGVSRDAADAPRRRHERRRDRRTIRADAGVGARQPASRDEAAAREIGMAPT